MKTTVIYHKSDFDGIFCREIARRSLPAAKLVGWEYGEPEPVVPADHDLYILDLSVPTLMEHPGLVWIDHHKSAIDRYSPSILGYRIDGVAACRLAWQWFRHWSQVDGLLPHKSDYVARSVAEPLAVRLAGEYDIWDKRDPNAELFQHGLRTRELLPGDWDALLGHDGGMVVADLLHGGRALEYAKGRENESIIKSNGFTLKWEGVTWLACNAARYNSHLFTAGIGPEHEALLGFALRGNGRWTVSLYGAPERPDLDLSVIAVKHGGGGHRQACGFSCDRLPWTLDGTDGRDGR